MKLLVLWAITGVTVSLSLPLGTLASGAPAHFGAQPP